MRYQNPILRGFHPDPSVCRVGADYYLVTSTFEYFPALPVYHSTDLINWVLIGHCIDRPEQLPFSLAGASGGVWAPTIRFFNGRFYVTASFNESQNFIVSSSSPASGYSNAVWVEMDGIDPSLFFEEGVLYYTANDCGSRATEREGISLAQLDPETGKVLGPIRRIWEGTGGGWLEASHLYHIGDWYYILTAEGGSGWGHQVTQGRSANIWGPYKPCPYNPILTNRNDTTKQVLETGHADYVEAPDGQPFLVHLGIRTTQGSKSNLGRETFLTPVQWQDGWMTVPGGKAVLEVETSGVARQRMASGFTADFGSAAWEREWLFPDAATRARLRRGDGALCMPPAPASLARTAQGAVFAAVRQPDFDCTLTATLEVPADGGVSGGVAAYLAPGFLYRCYLDSEHQVVVEKFCEDFHQIVCRVPVPQGAVTLRIRADRNAYRFGLLQDGAWCELGSASTRFLTTAIANRCFTGTVLGLFAEGPDGAPPLRVTRFAVTV